MEGCSKLLRRICGNEDINKTVKFVAISRVALFFFQVTCTYFGHKYDSASIDQSILSHQRLRQSFQISQNENKTQSDRFIEFLFAGYTNWDSTYFLNIATYGYEYEQMLAFFPAFPLLVSYFANLISKFAFASLSSTSLLILSSVILNLVAFTISAISLYKLTVKTTNDKKISKVTMMLFCINPASIFFMASYSESLFACFQFSGMLLVETKSSYRSFISGLLFAAASCTRSNGLISAGFLIYALLIELLTILKSQKTQRGLRNFQLIINVTKKITSACASVAVLFTSFGYFQFFGFRKYCLDHTRLEHIASHWCFKKLPMSYSYVQSFYWNVGAFKYFQWKQIPNFILALPIILLSYAAIFASLKKSRKDFWTFLMNDSRSVDLPKKITHEEDKKLLEMPVTIPYACHLLFLLTFGVINIHVQVLTRIIFAANPLVLWYTAEILVNGRKRNKPIGWKSYLLIGYYISYTLIGILLHSNFYPWT